MAKKKKGTRAGASKKAVKRAAPRRSSKAAKPKAKPPQVHRGLSQAGKVDFRYLKKDIDDHIARLSAMDQTNTRVAEALTVLSQARTALSNPCSPTMVIP